MADSKPPAPHRRERGPDPSHQESAAGSLGSTELALLRYIGDHHPITVGEAAEHMVQTTGQARTTILTIMERLRGKGYLIRKRIDGVYRYSPKVATTDLLRGLIGRFVGTTLGGSVSPFIAYLSGEGELSEADLDALKRLVRDMEQRRKEGRA